MLFLKIRGISKRVSPCVYTTWLSLRMGADNGFGPSGITV